MATVVISLGERLSPSQVKTFLGCSARWYFKYFVGLPEPKTGSLALGTAVHQALGKNFQQKIASREDLPVEEVKQAFGEAFDEAAEVTEFREDEDPMELKAVGARLTEKYMKECAPSVQPRMVEAEVSGKLGGVSVKGIVDLIDDQGQIIDIKTAARKPSGVSAGYGFQLATYAQLTPGASGTCRLDTLVKTKTVQLVHHTHQVGQEDVRHTETVYPMVRDAIQQGIYLPNRGSFLCSRRHCAFWRACEREYGGKVEER